MNFSAAFRLTFGFFVVVIQLCDFANAGLPPACSLPLADLVERTRPSVVNIRAVQINESIEVHLNEYFQFYGVPREERSQALGSGVVISKDGLIYTNDHVIKGADEIMVSFEKGSAFKAKIIGRDPKLDLALIQMEVPKTLKLSPAKIGQPEMRRVGDTVFAVGNPFGLSSTVTAGILSAKDRTSETGLLDNILQTDAAVNPGSSGGALFDCQGEVIGITTSIAAEVRQSAGLGFAIPITEAKKIERDLVQFGRVPRPWLGILVKSFPKTKLSPPGVLITQMLVRSPANRLGLNLGSILTHLDGAPTETPEKLQKQLFLKKPGDTVVFKLIYQGIARTLKMKLEEPRSDTPMDPDVI